MNIERVEEDYPHLDLIQSECQCGDGNNTLEYVMYTYHLIRHYFRVGVRANVYWNMALDNGGLSTWGRKDGSVVMNILNPYEFKKAVTVGDKNYRLKPRSFNTVML